MRKLSKSNSNLAFHRFIHNIVELFNDIVEFLKRQFMQIEKKLPKKTIIRLIKDDLRHSKLVWGLNMLGFKNDNAVLSISQAVFEIMELNTNDRRLDHLTDEYSDRSYQVNEYASNDSESFQRLAVEIYNWLLKERKKYKKRLLDNT